MKSTPVEVLVRCQHRRVNSTKSSIHSSFSNEIKDNRKPHSPRPLRKSASRAKAEVTPCIEAVELPVLFQPAFGTATCDSNNYGNYSQESGESQVLLKGKAEKEGERPAYKMLEDVQDGLCRHFTMTLNVIYKTLCRYLGLPEVEEKHGRRSFLMW